MKVSRCLTRTFEYKQIKYQIKINNFRKIYLLILIYKVGINILVYTLNISSIYRFIYSIMHKFLVLTQLSRGFLHSLVSLEILIKSVDRLIIVFGSTFH